MVQVPPLRKFVQTALNENFLPIGCAEAAHIHVCSDLICLGFLVGGSKVQYMKPYKCGIIIS